MNNSGLERAAATVPLRFKGHLKFEPRVKNIQSLYKKQLKRFKSKMSLKEFLVDLLFLVLRCTFYNDLWSEECTSMYSVQCSATGGMYFAVNCTVIIGVPRCT